MKKEGAIVNFDIELVGRVCRARNVKEILETKGYQASCSGNNLNLELWLKPNVSGIKFASDEEKVVQEGLVVTRVKPEAVTECTLIVMGLPFNSPDTVVHEMVENHGGHMVSPHCSMETIKDGPWRGQFNGTRRYRVEMGSQILPIGRYYLLDDTRVRVQYQGNMSTCARCHLFPADCLGGGRARDCEVAPESPSSNT